jgi:hypothetical protein
MPRTAGPPHQGGRKVRGLLAATDASLGRATESATCCRPRRFEALSRSYLTDRFPEKLPCLSRKEIPCKDIV